VKVYKNSTESANWLDQEQISALFQTKAQAGEQTADPLITILIVAGAAAAIVVVVILIVLSRKKKRAVEEEAKTAVQPVVEEPVEQRPEGKFPKDYYKFRREKFSRLKPVGLTRSGTCILGNSANKEAPEAAPEAAPAINTCPKCGIQMERNWKTCHNCGAKSTIERAGEAVAKLEQHGGTVTHVREMLASAESSREARNYDEAETYAHDVLDRAKALLKKYEESQRPSEPAPSYSTDESATREEGAAVAAPAATGEEGARGYAESATGARGYKEPSGAKEYTEKTPAEACKPDKKEPNPCWKCGQGLRPEWKKCPYCNSPQEGICPSCGRTVKIRWNNCPHCRTDLTVEKPKLACPVCGAELPAAGECQSCKALLLRDSTARLVKEVKGKGADVTEAESLIGRGELALKIKNYDKAVSHFLRAEELAKKSRKDYRTKRLKDRLDQAETLMKDSAEEGADVGEARSVLAQARKALLDDNIEEGLSLTDKASAMAEESLSKATAAKGAKTTIPISVRKPVVVGDVKVKPRCPHCQEQVEESWTVCPFCQSDLTNRCPKCGASVKPGWKMCPVCESPLG
jgi:predicted amidophosphoribosyltransferase